MYSSSDSGDKALRKHTSADCKNKKNMRRFQSACSNEELTGAVEYGMMNLRLQKETSELVYPKSIALEDLNRASLMINDWYQVNKIKKKAFADKDVSTLASQLCLDDIKMVRKRLNRIKQ